MLLAQDPKLLLVDEPVAGMTDAETAATAELLREIARDHSVIVVEHDMHFVRELGVKVTCLHEGSVLAEARSTRWAPTRALSKSIWGGKRGAGKRWGVGDPFPPPFGGGVWEGGLARFGHGARPKDCGDGFCRAWRTRGDFRSGRPPTPARPHKGGGRRLGAMLTVDRVDLFYGAAQALRSVSVKAQTGRILTVLGRNGVGKSSLLRAIVGQHMPAFGSIRWDDQDMTKMTPYLRAKAGFGYVPQGRKIFPLLTVRENLMTGYATRPRNERAIDDEIFSLFPVLNDMLGRRGGDLSGGQQQQLAIARALVTEAQTARPRRADRRHPALDHQGHRPRARASTPQGRDGDPRRRAIFRMGARHL